MSLQYNTHDRALEFVITCDDYGQFYQAIDEVIEWLEHGTLDHYIRMDEDVNIYARLDTHSRGMDKVRRQLNRL